MYVRVCVLVHTVCACNTRGRHSWLRWLYQGATIKLAMVIIHLSVAGTQPMTLSIRNKTCTSLASKNSILAHKVFLKIQGGGALVETCTYCMCVHVCVHFDELVSHRIYFNFPSTHHSRDDNYNIETEERLLIENCSCMHGPVLSVRSLVRGIQLRYIDVWVHALGKLVPVLYLHHPM